MTHIRVRAPHHKGPNKPPQFSKEEIASWRPRLRAGMKNKDLAAEKGITPGRLSTILAEDAQNV